MKPMAWWCSHGYHKETPGPIRLWCTPRLYYSLAVKPLANDFFTSASLFPPRESEAKDVDIFKIKWEPHGRKMCLDLTAGCILGRRLRKQCWVSQSGRILYCFKQSHGEAEKDKENLERSQDKCLPVTASGEQTQMARHHAGDEMCPVRGRRTEQCGSCRRSMLQRSEVRIKGSDNAT